VPALPSSILEPLWVQVAALLPVRQVHHPPGCPRPRIADRVVFDKLIQVLVFGCGDRRIADATCSATTLRRRRDEWIALGLADRLWGTVPGADDQLFGLELDHRAVDGCITKAPCGGQVAGPSPVDRRKQGLKRSVLTDADGIPLGAVPAPANRRDDGLLAATLDTRVVVERCLPGRWCTWMPATTISPAGRRWPHVAWSARSPRGACQPRSRRAVAGRWSAPTPGAPGRQAALVHRAAPAGRPVLAGACQRRHRLRPPGPSCLDLLPLGRPTHRRP
jgi:transposase